MHQIVGFVKYYITFEATDAAAGSTKTFEAIVLRRIPIDYECDPYEIWLCREQGDRTGITRSLSFYFCFVAFEEFHYSWVILFR